MQLHLKLGFVFVPLSNWIMVSVLSFRGTKEGILFLLFSTVLPHGRIRVGLKPL